MNYSAANSDLAALRTPCLGTSLAVAKRLAKATGNTATRNRAITDFKDQIGESLTVNLDGPVARVVIMGGAEECSPTQYRKLATLLAQKLAAMNIAQAAVHLLSTKIKSHNTAWKAQALMQALSHASYRFNHYKSKPKQPVALKRVRLLAGQGDQKALRAAIKLGNALDAGLALAKDLGNEPSNVCTPTYLLGQARKIARSKDVSLTALDEKKMLSLGMGAFMSVSQGSDQPGKMIILRYNAGKKADAPIALVGKGITFDTGGISLKPPPAMDEMKFDMCGAAAVLGVTKAAIDAQLPINLVTVVAAAENMPSGRATRPGDIVTSASGQTIEILNTDAEGRLVLCDALTHVQTYKPKAIIDVATLTGACIMALGSHASGLFANDDELADAITAAGETSGDRSWRLPLWDEYQASLNTNFADMANVGGGGAGSVTAACFLSRFVKGQKWAHMDIAGSSFHKGGAKGSSGRPVAQLFAYLVAQSGLN
jgi:leucyl aminopeptidase